MTGSLTWLAKETYTVSNAFAKAISTYLEISIQKKKKILKAIIQGRLVIDLVSLSHNNWTNPIKNSKQINCRNHQELGLFVFFNFF